MNTTLIATNNRLQKIGMLVVAGSLLGWSAGAQAATVTNELDSGDFAYKYEMDVNPSSLDLDGNGTEDFFAGAVPSGQTIPQTYVNGIASSDSASNENLFRTDITGGLRETLSANTPFTLEYSVQKVGETVGSAAWFAAALQSPGATHSVRVNLADDHVSYTGIGDPFLVGTDFTSGFHDVRIAYAGDDDYFVWVNDILLNEDLDTGFAGGNTAFNSSGSWLIGNFSSNIAGDWDIDYLRFDDTGAYAPTTTAVTPIPEPASLALLGIGSLAMLRRRRTPRT